MITQSAARNLMVLMVDSADHVTGKTGLTLTLTLSKDGAAFASISPTVTERGNGWYSVALTSSHTDTVGDLVLHATASGADPTDVREEVAAASAGGTDWTSGEREQIRHRLGIDGTASAPSASPSLASSAQVAAIETDTQDLQARVPAALVSGRIDASVGAMAAGVVTAAAVGTGAIDADALASDAVTEIQAGLATSSEVAAVGSAVLTRAAPGDAMDLVADAVDAAALAASAVSEIQSGLATSAEVVAVPAAVGALEKDGLTLLEHQGLQSGMLAGKVTGGPGHIFVRDVGDTRNVAEIVADENGNRSVSVVTP